MDKRIFDAIDENEQNPDKMPDWKLMLIAFTNGALNFLFWFVVMATVAAYFYFYGKG